MKTLIEMWHKVWPNSGAFVRASAQDLERFAELVRADEREACAKVCESRHWTVDSGNHFAADIRARGNT